MRGIPDPHSEVLTFRGRGCLLTGAALAEVAALCEIGSRPERPMDDLGVAHPLVDTHPHAADRASLQVVHEQACVGLGAVLDEPVRDDLGIRIEGYRGPDIALVGIVGVFTGHVGSLVSTERPHHIALDPTKREAAKRLVL